MLSVVGLEKIRIRELSVSIIQVLVIITSSNTFAKNVSLRAASFKFILQIIIVPQKSSRMTCYVSY